ncbi:MAG: TetR/AcrR family transcriptional regulator [Ruminococcaceae bacterium]|nr:TetR/AcrR family transcriptional regulator [Oscillospiraceae bacterium]
MGGKMFIPHNQHEKIKLHVLYTATQMFLESGYTAATMRGIAERSGIKYGSMRTYYATKEDILCDLVNFVIQGQFSFAEKLLEGKTDDKIMLYAAETTLQLHIAESSEQLRELYLACYSLPNSSDRIFHKITGKLESTFKENLPHWETKDFYERELASAGIMRSFLSVPCDMYFTMDRKIRVFLEATFLVYHVSDAKIEEVIEFVSQFDWPDIARRVIQNMLDYLKEKSNDES